MPLEIYKDSFHWSTSDSNVATVSDGVITAKGEGVAVISAQAQQIDGDEFVTAASVTNSSHYALSNVLGQGNTVSIAFVIDSIYSNQVSLDTFRTNITNTLKSLMEKTNIKVVFIDSDKNTKVGEITYYRTNNDFAKHTLEQNISSYFSKINPGGRTPTPNELMASVNSGMVNGSKALEEYEIVDSKSREYVLFYTRHRAQFVDSQSILTELGKTTGLVVGQTIAYYDSGTIAYNQSNINTLVKFLFEGSNRLLAVEYTGQRPWSLRQGGDNVKNDVIVLQKLLMANGYLKTPDGGDFGTFGPLTKKAVEDYQRDKRLVVDGIVGKNTWMALNTWPTHHVLWDNSTAQPNRETWTYRYTLQNIYYFNQAPRVDLTSPTKGSTIKAGEDLVITGEGRQCHHVALFINDEWVKTAFDNTGLVSLINMYHKISSHGLYSIQLKGRSVPNGDDATTLAVSEIVQSRVPIKFADQNDDAVIKVRQVGNIINFDVDIGFNDTVGINQETGKTYEQLAIEGIEKWNGKVEYDGFEYVIQMVLSKRSQKEVDNRKTTSNIREQNNNFGYLEDYDMIYTFISNVNYLRSRRHEGIGMENWNVNSVSSIYLGTLEATAEQFKITAAHEFGHALGLMDAYIHFLDGNNVFDVNASIEGVSDRDIMWGGNRIDTIYVTDLNRKMVLDAFVENRHQGYKVKNGVQFKNRHIP
ncbi:UNVERIFIED_CONTAM: putative peptidoglycan-binding domain-containing protein [Acetivibrio alkalicellulosi]